MRPRLEENEDNNDGYSPTSLAQTPTNNPATPSETHPQSFGTGVEEPQHEPEIVHSDVTEPPGNTQEREGNAPPGVGNNLRDDQRSEYGPVRTHQPLMTAMRTNLNLLDQGGPIRRGSAVNVGNQNSSYHMHAQQHVQSPPQPFAENNSSPQPFEGFEVRSSPQPFTKNSSSPQPFTENSSSPQPFEGFEVNMTEKRRGRKEVFENELKPCHRPGLQKAKLKELNKLVSSGAVRVLSKQESDAVRNDSKLRGRILKSRYVITKADEQELNDLTELKARWCIRGYQDPDLLRLDTEAPTLSSEGCAIALQCVASHKWTLQICDVEGAFLRGDNLNRADGRIFVSQPPGGMEGMEEGALLECVKAVYGLADAPLAWYQSFTRTLRELNCKQSKFDGCLYYAHSKHRPHHLIGVVAIHVDDMCLGGNEEFMREVVEPLKRKYPFKHWHVGKGEFLGKHVEQMSNGDIVIQQTEYARRLKGIEISTQRKRSRDAETTDEEKKNMRAVLGAVNWLVTGTRPDLAASCSLLQQRVTQSVVEDLVDTNRLVACVHEHANMKVKIKHIPPKDMCFMAVSDAAWANASEKFSQAGYMVAAVDKKMMHDVWATFSLLRWKSYKQDRRTPSTLGAELFALSRALAETRWMRSMWCEAMFAEYSVKEDDVWEKKVPILAIVDNKPLFDHTRAGNNTNIRDKRHAIEMLIVKEDLSTHHIHLRWVATYQMLGDILTKKGVSVSLLGKIMEWGKFIIVEDNDLLPRNGQSVKKNYFGDV